MDPCNTPDLVALSTMADVVGEPRIGRTFFPQFARSKTLLHADVLGTPLEDALHEEPDPISWSEKQDQRMMWRGRTTGRGSSKDWDVWRHAQRLRLVELTNRTNGTVPVLVPPKNDDESTSGSNAPKPTTATNTAEAPATKMIELAELNKFFDVGLVDTVQCQDDICDKIWANYAMKELIYPQRGQHYKYVMDVSRPTAV